VAGVLGIPSAELRAAVEDNPGEFPPEIATLIRPGGTLYREVLEQRFADLVIGLGLGVRITAEGPVAVQPAQPAPAPAPAGPVPVAAVGS
jgi:hypothetical protein